MYILSHPSAQLEPDQIALIRNTAAAAEQARQLLPEQLELIYEQQWFKILTPKKYGGLEIDLNNEVRLLEALAWADGSLGWVITLCTGAGWFGGFLDPALAEEVFAMRDVCLAGSGAPTGTADIAANKYTVNGTWKYASGALNTTHFTANCLITKNGQPVLAADGKQQILSFLFKSAEVTVIPAWAYSGMVSTGSHSFQITNAIVPLNRTFRIDPEYVKVNKALYHYPFHQLAEATLAINISGMAIHFIDLCRVAFAKKRVEKNLNQIQDSEMSDVLDLSIYKLNMVRDVFYQDLDNSWANYANSDQMHLEENLQSLSWSSRKLAKKARQIVDDLFPYCGLEAARTHSELNRVWRDIHTASQHALLTFSV